MRTKILSILFSGLLAVSFVRAAEGPADSIPPDSTATSMWRAFRAGLDSAQRCRERGAYKEAVGLYADAFVKLQEHDTYARRYAADFLAEKYQTRQKEKRAAFLNETLELKKTQHMLLVALAACVLLVLVGLFFLLSYRLRSILNRTEHEQNQAAIIALSKEGKELEARVREAETERYRKELLAESLLVTHKDFIVDELRKLVADNPDLLDYREELVAILTDATPRDEVETGCADIREIHPAFYEELQKRAGDRLTTLDLEYCRMLLLGMSTKEMADILRVDPKTVRVGKYRLKRKLGLDRADDLAGYVRSVI